VTGDHVVVAANQNRVGPAEFANGRVDLSDLGGCMCARVVRPRQKPFDRPTLHKDVYIEPSG
jgi:hypothetical protein